MIVGQTIVLHPRPPFRLAPTVRVLQRRPTNLVDVWEGERYWRVLPTATGDRLVAVAEAGSADTPRLLVDIFGEPLPVAEAERLAGAVGRILGVAVDTSPFCRLAMGDEALAPAVRALYGLKPPRFPSLGETLVNVVVFQQISLSAALAISGRLVERYGRPVAVGGRVYHAFPSAESLAEAELAEMRALGLTWRKAQTVRDLSQRVARGDLREVDLVDLSTEEGIGRLVALPGIGRWSAEVILLRGLGRLDVFPSGDAGACRGLGNLYGLPSPPSPAQERGLVQRYGEQRGLLYFYTLGARLLALGLLG